MVGNIRDVIFHDSPRERTIRLVLGCILLAAGGYLLIRGGSESNWLPELGPTRPAGPSNDLVYVFQVDTVWVLFLWVNASRIFGWVSVCGLAAWTMRVSIMFWRDEFSTDLHYGCIECNDQIIMLLLPAAGIGLGATIDILLVKRLREGQAYSAPHPVMALFATCAIPCWLVSLLLSVL